MPFFNMYFLVFELPSCPWTSYSALDRFLGRELRQQDSPKQKTISLQEILIPGVCTEAACCVWSFCLLTGIACRKLVESLVIDVGC